MARPKIVWTEKQYKTLEGLCAIQCSILEIENVLDIRHETLDRLCREHYKDADGKPMRYSQVYKKYSETGKTSLRRTQFKMAEHSVPMAIFLGKQYLGQSDEVRANVEVTEPVKIIRQYDGGIAIDDGK